MTPYRTFVYLLKRKRRHKKLILPFVFFLLELNLIVLIGLNILGVNISPTTDNYMHEPMLFIRGIHPPALIAPHELFAENISMFTLNTAIPPILTLANMASVFVAFMGLLISILWMNRFFKLNSINIEWWLWPTGCVCAHALFFLAIVNF